MDLCDTQHLCSVFTYSKMIHPIIYKEVLFLKFPFFKIYRIHKISSTNSLKQELFESNIFYITKNSLGDQCKSDVTQKAQQKTYLHTFSNSIGSWVVSQIPIHDHTANLFNRFNGFCI